MPRGIRSVLTTTIAVLGLSAPPPPPCTPTPPQAVPHPPPPGALAPRPGASPAPATPRSTVAAVRNPAGGHDDVRPAQVPLHRPGGQPRVRCRRRRDRKS